MRIMYPIGLWMARGKIDNHAPVHKFGHNNALTTAYTPVTAGGKWQTPQVSGATQLRIKAGGATEDTAVGVGARAVTVYGINILGEEINEVIATNGALVSLATTKVFLRLLKIRVTTSGTYGSAVAGSHYGDIVIENAAGGTDWGVVPLNSFPHARSQIGVYTVPLGKIATISDIEIAAAANKFVDFIFMSRANILDTAPPYSPVEAHREIIGVSGPSYVPFEYSLGPFAALTDIGFMAKGANNPAASVHFTMILRNEDV